MSCHHNSVFSIPLIGQSCQVAAAYSLKYRVCVRTSSERPLRVSPLIYARLETEYLSSLHFRSSTMDKRSRYNRLQVRLEKLMHCQKIDADIIMYRQQSQI